MAELRRLQEQNCIGCANFAADPEEVERINAERQFMKACFDKNVNQVNTSLHEGVNANVSLSGLTTPFQIACSKGLDTKILKDMLDKGADIDHMNQIHFTALHMAALNGKKDTCKFLIEQGAEKYVKSLIGQTAADLADAHGFRHELE